MPLLKALQFAVPMTIVEAMQSETDGVPPKTDSYFEFNPASERFTPPNIKRLIVGRPQSPIAAEDGGHRRRGSVHSSTLRHDSIPSGLHGSTDAMDPDDIDNIFGEVATYFKGTIAKKDGDPSIEHVDKSLRARFGERLNHLDKEGDDRRSFLHYLLQTAEQFKKRLPLIKWAMHTYPTLYLAGVDQNETILHLAAKMCGRNKEKEYLSSLIDLYPQQSAEILGSVNDVKARETLIREIIPFIQTSASPAFLRFFGECPEALEPKRVSSRWP
jgi:hypothetical protein